jgi:hypothetical protein
VPKEIKAESLTHKETQRLAPLGRTTSRLEAPEVLRARCCRYAWWSSGFGLGRLVSVGGGGVVVDGGLSRY